MKTIMVGGTAVFLCAESGYVTEGLLDTVSNFSDMSMTETLTPTWGHPFPEA
jgi:hypothetical protein